MPAATNERAIAGPAIVPAALPVRTKIPVPMITPIPITVRSIGPSARRSRRSGSSVSAIDCSTVFVRSRFSGIVPPGTWPVLWFEPVHA